MLKRFLIYTLCFTFYSEVAMAQSCTGVEARVNGRTSSLSSAVISRIGAITTQYSAQQILERNQILSALKVLGKQNEVSTEQEISAATASAKALSDTIVKESVLSATADAVESFGTTGYNACALVEAGDTLSEMVVSSKEDAIASHKVVMDAQDVNVSADHSNKLSNWNAFALSDTTTSVADVMDGDIEKAAAYANLVLGPPRAPAEGAGAASKIDRVVFMQDLARRSVVSKTLTTIAANQQVGDALKEITDTWIGEDGGAEWSAKLAASPLRAVMLDLVRLEAAQIASQALEMKKKLNEELALATFALTVTDNRISGGAN